MSYAEGFVASLAIGVAAMFCMAGQSRADKVDVIAIDIALEPDGKMLDEAKAANARLLGVFPQGFALDATHTPHITMVQQFVRTSDLGDVYAAANKVLAGVTPISWTLTASKYYYIPDGQSGLGGIVVEPTADLKGLQQKLLDAVAPYALKTGTAASFVSDDDGKDIQPSLIDYIANFGIIAAGEKFNPHVTIGVGPVSYLDGMLAEPFESFSFSPVGASVYQLGAYGTARKELIQLSVKP
ncbi:2'-5' RNA ligase family protein [Aestuariivirga sp.]|uniref:2'-5' RNA ligase family protein n=1 Tax=Aestuariivirga sp. TaxID=2650926 RepID=UPI003BABD3C7